MGKGSLNNNNNRISHGETIISQQKANIFDLVITHKKIKTTPHPLVLQQGKKFSNGIKCLFVLDFVIYEFKTIIIYSTHPQKKLLIFLFKMSHMVKGMMYTNIYVHIKKKG